MDKVCILGIDGFTGRHLQRYIDQHGLTQQLSFVGISRTSVPASFPVQQIQATDRAALARALLELQPEYIINLVGSPQPPTLDAAILLNATISQWVCEIVVEAKLPIKKILAIGSAAEYGRAQTLPISELHPLTPISTYGLAKQWQSSVLTYFHRAYGVPINIARTFNIVGPGLPTYLAFGSFIEQIQQASSGTSLQVGNLESRRDYVVIDDVIDAYWKILVEAPAGEIYNVCAGKSYAIGELLNHLIQQSGKKLQLQVDPRRLRADDQPDVYGDNSKLKNATTWEPAHDVLLALTQAVQK